MAAVVMFGAVACSQYDEQEVVEGQEVTTTFAIGLENLGTRVAGDSGMIDKVAWGIYEHQEDGTGRFLRVHSSANPENGPADFDGKRAEIEVTLFTGKKYDLVFIGYCNKAHKNKLYTVDWENRKFNVNYENVPANLEVRDAFYHIESGFVAGVNKTFTLRRPFAQLNVGQSLEDYNIMQLTDNYIEKSYVKAKAYKTMSLVDGSVSDLVDVEFAMNNVLNTVVEEPKDQLNDAITVNEVAYKHIAMNYLLVNEKQNVNEVEFKFTENTTTGAPTVFTRTYYNVPLQRNFRTNILGRIISDEYNFEIVIDADFNEPDNIIFHAFQHGGVVDLTSNTEVSNPLIVENNANAVLNLNGHTIENNGSNKAQVIEVAPGASLTINGEGTLVGGSVYDYGFIANGSNAVLNNVDINSKGGGVGVYGGAKVTFSGDVHVDSPSTSGRYVFYTEDAGSELTIKGGNFSWNPSNNNRRAYINAEPGTTVYVEGGNFGKPSTRSEYSAGIKGGGTVIITGGTFGFDPTKWVAPGYTAIKEGAKWTVVYGTVADDASELSAALQDGATVILKNGVNYGAITAGELKDVTIKGYGAVMNFVTDANSKLENVTLNDVSFVYDGTNQNSGIVINADAQIENLVVNGCSFVGTGEKKGRGIYGQNPTANIELKNCTFKNLGYPIYTMAGGGYESLVVEGCTFELIKSWAIMPQYNDYAGDLTVTGCTFTNCTGGLVKAGAFTAGHTFTFTNNTVTNSSEHPAKNWFTIDTAAASKVVEGNTKDGAAWTPGVAEGLK